jgi:hypothetical protein
MTEELIQWLKDHEFDRPDVFQKIAAEEYDKNSFCLATDDDLKDVCRARGPWLQLRRLRDKLKESTNVKESTDSQFHVHLAATSSHPVTVNDEWSGKDTAEYKAVLEASENIIRTLLATPGSTSTLSTKFMQQNWIEITSRPSAKELVVCACAKIELKANEFKTFLGMLNDMAGMNIIVNKLKAAVVQVVSSHRQPVEHPVFDFSGFGEPTLRDLMNHVGHLSAKWREIGSELGISESDLDIIQYNQAGIPNLAQTAMRAVFQKWNASMTSTYSWENLANVLKSNAVGEKAVVRVLYEQLSQK